MKINAAGSPGMDIAILIYDGFTALDAVGPYEVLVCLPEAKIRFVAKDVGPKRTHTNVLSLVADYKFSDITHPDIVIIPGGTSGTLATMKDEDTLDWVRTVHESSKWTTSVCTGALILGAAGVLQGVKATTHWYARSFFSQFGTDYTNERVVRQGKVITAAGVSAGIDMALYLAGEIAGRETAQMIQLLLEYDPQPPFQTGSLQKAPANIIDLAERAAQRDFG
jgi:putative intracellular protease/amidase